MPSPASSIDQSSSAAPPPPTASLLVNPSLPHSSTPPGTDLRDVSDDDDDDDDGYHDDGFDAAHAAFLARRIAASAPISANGGGMSPFDESAIDREWEELVRTMKAVVPSQTTDHNTNTTHSMLCLSSLLTLSSVVLCCYIVLGLGCTACSSGTFCWEQFGSDCVCDGMHVAGLQIPQSSAR